MEKALLGAMLKSRSSFELIRDYIVPKNYSKEFQVLADKVRDYYNRDPAVQEVDSEILFAQMQESIRSEKHLETFRKAINDAVSIEALPEQNIKDLVLQAKLQEKGDALATALVNNPKAASELAKEFLALSELSTLDALVNTGLDIIEEADLEEMIAEESDKSGCLKLYPSVLNDRLDGGVRGGHHITYFGRPEAGKSTAAMTAACGFARQGFDGMYIGNEDRNRDLAMRMLSNMSGKTKREIEANPKEAIALAKKEGYSNLRIIALAPGTPAQIESLIKKYKPKWVVIDQLRNLNVASDTRVNQLEAAATFARNMAKKHNLVMISVTQAGDSGSDKAVLEMGDIDFSNTGIPAQADVLIGVGVTATLEADGKRWFSLCKNKISGSHDNFPVKIEATLSRMLPV